MVKTKMSKNGFDAVVRKSGNSLVITIPYNVAKAHNIQAGTALNVSVLKVGDQKEETK